MGEFGADLEGAIKHGVSWFNDQEVLKYFFIIALAYFFLNVSLILFKDSLTDMLVLVAAVIVLVSVIFVCGLLVLLKALSSVTKVKRRLDLSLVVDYVILLLKILVWAVLSLDRKKFLAIPAGVAVAGILSFVFVPFSMIFLPVAAILFLAYFFVIVYNCLRLSFAPYNYFTEEMSRDKAMAVSNAMTGGKVLGVLGRQSVSLLILGVVAGVLFSIAGLVLSLIGSLAGETGSAILGGIASSFSNAFTAVSSSFVLAYVYAIYLKIFEGQGGLKAAYVKRE